MLGEVRLDVLESWGCTDEFIGVQWSWSFKEETQLWAEYVHWSPVEMEIMIKDVLESWGCTDEFIGVQWSWSFKVETQLWAEYVHWSPVELEIMTKNVL